MPVPSFTSEEQLRRQRSWLSESWTWLVQNRVLPDFSASERPTALDVGCGPGLVMELLALYLDVKGIDIDAEAVSAARSRGLDAIVARAEDLPFEDSSVDVVYSSFLLLWTKDPVQVVREMARVSRRWVICLAEPDYGGRISYPASVSVLDKLLLEGLEKQGADPRMGRKLSEVFGRCGLTPEVGAYSSNWGVERLRREGDDEWRALAALTGLDASDPVLSQAKVSWVAALNEGSLFQYNPIFYALARKK